MVIGFIELLNTQLVTTLYKSLTQTSVLSHDLHRSAW
jgi:hypothetical protein